MPSVNIRDPFTEEAFRENRQQPPTDTRQALRPARLGEWVRCRGPWYVLTVGLLALAAMLRG